MMHKSSDSCPPANYAHASIKVQADVGFGDVVTPTPREAEYPVLLDFPAPRLRTYPRETVVTEKFEAMVSLGLANSRMKDFHDVRSLRHDFVFEGGSLSEAIKKTFARRETALPREMPLIFTAEFFNDSDKKKQWAAFCSKNRNYVPEVSLEQVCGEIAAFVGPILDALNGKRATPNQWQRDAWRE